MANDNKRVTYAQDADEDIMRLTEGVAEPDCYINICPESYNEYLKKVADLFLGTLNESSLAGECMRQVMYMLEECDDRPYNLRVHELIVRTADWFLGRRHAIEHEQAYKENFHALTDDIDKHN